MGYYDSLAFCDENPVIERVLASSPPDGSSWFLGGKCNSFIVSPEESFENSNEGVHFFYLLDFWVKKRIFDFQFKGGNVPF